MYYTYTITDPVLLIRKTKFSIFSCQLANVQLIDWHSLCMFCYFSFYLFGSCKVYLFTASVSHWVTFGIAIQCLCHTSQYIAPTHGKVRDNIYDIFISFSNIKSCHNTCDKGFQKADDQTADLPRPVSGSNRYENIYHHTSIKILLQS